MITDEILDKTPIIYKITNIVNGRFYIGSACEGRRRFNEHGSSLEAERKTNKYLQRAYKKYGAKSFVFSIVEIVEDLDNLIPREQYYLDALLFAQEYIATKGKDKRFRKLGYNISPTAGNCRGVKHSEETKRKISEIQKGKKLTDSHKKKLSMFFKGRPGKPASESTKQKQREAKLKNPTRYWLGRNHSEETKLKIASNNHNIKSAIFIAPDGSEVLVTNLAKFARNNGLDPANFWSVYAGKAKSHKGYRLKQAA